MPIGQKEVVSEEELAEVRQAFNEFDLDGNGHITSKEIGEVMKAVGEDIPGYKLRDMIREVDDNKNGTVEFDEFLKVLMWLLIYVRICCTYSTNVHLVSVLQSSYYRLGNRDPASRRSREPGFFRRQSMDISFSSSLHSTVPQDFEGFQDRGRSKHRSSSKSKKKKRRRRHSSSSSSSPSPSSRSRKRRHSPHTDPTEALSRLVTLLSQSTDRLATPSQPAQTSTSITQPSSDPLLLPEHRPDSPSEVESVATGDFQFHVTGSHSRSRSRSHSMDASEDSDDEPIMGTSFSKESFEKAVEVVRRQLGFDSPPVPDPPMLKSVRSDRVEFTFQKAVKTRQGVTKKGGTSETSAEGTTHSYSDAEKVGFVDYINNWLKDDEDVKRMLPINKDSDDIFTVVGDGILLCKMINAAAPDTIDRRTINFTKLNVYTKHENNILALNSAKSIGCCIVNIGAEDISKGKPHLILGLLWQVIRIGLFAKIDLSEVPGLVRLLRDGETIEDLRALSPEELLIRWVNYHLEQDGSMRRITNFSGDIKDSEVYSILLHQIAPKENPLSYISLVPDHHERAESVLQNADVIGCRAFVTPNDIVKGNQKLNMAFVANLFNHYPALEPTEEEFEYVEETREEKTFRNWMNSLGVTPRLEDMIQPGIVNWDKVNKPPFKQMGGKMKKIENCNYAVELGHKMKFSLVGIGGEDIHNGTQTLTLDKKPIQDKEIVAWANEKITEKFDSSAATFSSFKDSSLSDSKAILQLIEALKPGSVKWDDKISNAQYALSLGRRVGAPFYALPEDIVEVKPKMLLTTFAFLMAVGLQQSASN
ncbi:Plastin-3 [Holothuria leucospilota]|uniref:Plastin-3 n=1 Tax=Holothuria leucospilota TaxID=206669 RepID=A0A9Q1HKG0_HOLLE|nr:Plastin-3 [Holothuria leucospilota]